MPSAQSTAWDAYLIVTRGLLPALQDPNTDPAMLNCRWEAAVTRIVRYAPLWGDRGPMLLSALRSAERLHRAGDRDDLADLTRTIGDWLYALSARPRLPRRGPGG
jgi:hypothetical protein